MTPPKAPGSARHAGCASDAAATQQLLATINQGPLLVNYIGHGSETEWRAIFTSDDAAGLKRVRLRAREAGREGPETVAILFISRDLGFVP